MRLEEIVQCDGDELHDHHVMNQIIWNGVKINHDNDVVKIDGV